MPDTKGVAGTRKRYFVDATGHISSLRENEAMIFGTFADHEESMTSEHVDVATVEWTSGVPFYGPQAFHDGKEIVQLKVLSDRRHHAGGIAWLVKFSPPPGKLIKIVATALSDEHVFSLEGGRSTKSGRPARISGGYSLNPKGQPHSAMFATESIFLVIYAGEPDEINSMEVVPVSPTL